MNQNSQNLSRILKYCYLSTRKYEQLLKKVIETLLVQTNDISYGDIVIRDFVEYFDKNIFVYFNINRSKFNQLRRLFYLEILQVLISFDCGYTTYSTEYFDSRLPYWADKVGLEQCRACSVEYAKTKDRLRLIGKLPQFLDKIYTNS